jgi:hypothetical protein
MDPSQVNSFFETKIKNRVGFGLKKEQCKLISQINLRANYAVKRKQTEHVFCG